MSKRKNKGRDNKAAKRIPILTDTVVILPHAVESMLQAEVASQAQAQSESESGFEFDPDVLDDIGSETPEAANESSEAISEPAWPSEQTLEELRSNLTTQTIDLASQLMHGAVREMEAALLEQVLDRLKEQLPSLIDDVLNEQLAANASQTEESN
jgi:hypothetical protein